MLNQDKSWRRALIALALIGVYAWRQDESLLTLISMAVAFYFGQQINKPTGG